MLTLDLLRCKVSGDSITPIYLSVERGAKYVRVAERIMGLFHAGVGGTVGELDEALDEVMAGAADYKVCRGLTKLMFDYTVTAPPSELDSEELRRKVFTMAAEGPPPARRADLLFHSTSADRIAEIAASLGLEAPQLLSTLYADLPENRIVREVDMSVTPIDLLERYNTALAQAILYRATRMIVDIRDGYRSFFTHLKLARLMHTIKPIEGGYRVDVDGPASIFCNVERYGVGMAHLLPAVLKGTDWNLAAKVNYQGGEKLFRLSPRQGLVSHYRDLPEFDSAYEEAFYTKFARKKKNKWTVQREGSVLGLGGMIMIPDFKFTHKDGRVAHLEIVGYWTPEYLRKKLEKLSLVAEKNVVIAVPQSLNCSTEDFDGPVVHYKQRLLIKDVLPIIESVAAQPANSSPE